VFLYFCRLNTMLMEIKCFIVNPLEERCSIIWDESRECAIVDPGYYSEKERESFHSFIRTKGLVPKMIILTHAHFDHILGVADCARTYNIPVYMNPLENIVLAENSRMCGFLGIDGPDKDFRTTDVHDGDILTVGGLNFAVIDTPGHSPGGVCYLCREEKLVFSGDTLFQGCIGRTDFIGGDYDALMNSIFMKLMVLDGDIDIIPGHGGCTTIADERQKNPFLQPFNEPE